MEYQLIDFIKANPILYEKKYKSSSKYSEMKMEKWIELATLMGRDPTSVKSKWKNLRDTYRKQLIRKPNGSGEEEEYVENSKWKFFSHLSFLKDQYENTRNESTYEDTGESELETSQYDTEENTCNDDHDDNEDTVVDFEVENFDLNEYLKRFDVKPTALTATTSNENQTQNTTTMTAEEAHQAKRKKLDKDAIISEACQEMSALLQNAKQHFVPPSPNQVFFNSIALQVEQAKLPPMDLMRLQQRVLELVTHEIALYQERTYHIAT